MYVKCFWQIFSKYTTWGEENIGDTYSGVKLRHPFIHIMIQHKACIMKMKLCFWKSKTLAKKICEHVSVE